MAVVWKHRLINSWGRSTLTNVTNSYSSFWIYHTQKESHTHWTLIRSYSKGNTTVRVWIRGKHKVFINLFACIYGYSLILKPYLRLCLHVFANSCKLKSLWRRLFGRYQGVLTRHATPQIFQMWVTIRTLQMPALVLHCP